MLAILATGLLIAFAALMILGAVRDVMSFTIPNWISLALVALFLPAALVVGAGWVTGGLHVLTGIVALMAGMALFAFRIVGGGDAKLLAAACLWMGWPDVVSYLLIVAVMGGVFTLFLLLARRFVEPLATMRGWSVPILQRKDDIPYGVAIAGAALLMAPKAGLGAALIAAAASIA